VDHIVVNVQPFIYEQEILIYKNEECTNIEHSKLTELDENIALYAKLHNIKNIDLVGNPFFTERLKERLTLNKFNLDLNVVLY